MLSESDSIFIDGLSTRVINAFRDDTFPEAFISGNSHLFLNTEWINVPKLKEYVSVSLKTAIPATVKMEEVSAIIKAQVEPVKEEPIDALIKSEPNDQTATRLASTRSRRQLDNKISSGPKPIRTRILEEDAKEVIEILSDSEDEVVVNLPKSSGKLESAATPRAKRADSPTAFNPLSFTQESDTLWTDSDLTSHVIDIEGDLLVTSEMRVKRVEYLSEIPHVWPVPRVPTAFIVDLQDAKFRLYKNDSDGKLLTPDFLIKNKCQDSWRGGTGTADSTAEVCFQPGFPRITCRRSRLICRGCYACEAVDPDLLDVQRYELDPGPRSKIFAAEQATRVEERSGIEQRAATFVNVCRSRCPAVDSEGERCLGQPKMKEKVAKGQSGLRGHHYWIACDGWQQDFKENHQTRNIPDDVDEGILSKLLRGTPLDQDHDTSPCGTVVSSHVGKKLQFCSHPHIKDGVSLRRTPITNRPCPSKCTIYVPIDSRRYRFALLIHPGNIPHNHPMPRIAKASFETKGAYRTCVEAAGTVGTTVLKVDEAPSTTLLLGGQKPDEYNSSLYNGRVKRSIIQGVKVKRNPAGLGLAGLFDLYRKDLLKIATERYVHSFINTKEGGTIVFTCVPSLLKLVHEVTSFECDVTFKRVQDLNEWEMVIYYPPVQRAITIARAYVDRADTEHYTSLFDELQALTVSLTGKPLRFKRFSAGGNLLCMNADMEAAQILGAGKSFMPTNEPGYSKIDVNTPEELLSYFVRVCLTHSKRGVLDFKSLVTSSEYSRLLDFPYMKSQQELDNFTVFVNSLGNKKIQDWWSHKIKSKWIIPCILASQSNILPEHWATTPATTNIGESQHHWTNMRSGIKLPLVEGIESARLIDQGVADEIGRSLASGIMKNTQTELFHRQSRGTQRQNATSSKVRQASAIRNSTLTLQDRISNEKDARHTSLIQQRQYEESLKLLISERNGTRTMGIDSFKQANDLRARIDKEKQLRRTSNALQKTLVQDLQALLQPAKTHTKPHPSQIVEKVPLASPRVPDASSSGRVTAGISTDISSDSESDFSDRQSGVKSTQCTPCIEEDQYDLAEREELEDDPDANSFMEGEPHAPGSLIPQVLGSIPFNTAGGREEFTNSEVAAWQAFEKEYAAQTERAQRMFNTNSSIAFDYYNSEPEDEQLTSMLNGETYNLHNSYGPQSHDLFNLPDPGWRSTGSGAAGAWSSGDEYPPLSSHISGTSERYPSSGPEYIYSSRSLSISTHTNTFLPAFPDPQPPSSPEVPSISVVLEPIPLVGSKKRSRLADFDEENILPQEERRKRIKPTRLGEL